MRSRASLVDYLYKERTGVRVVDLCITTGKAGGCGDAMHNPGHEQLRESVEKSKIGISDKQQAIKSLSKISEQLEKDFIPDDDLVEKVIAKERAESYKHGGRTVFGKAQPLLNNQLSLFE